MINLLCKDLNKQQPSSGSALVFTPLFFNFTYNSITNKYVFGLQTSIVPTIGLGVFTFYTSQNSIMGASVGSSTDIMISTTGGYPTSTIRAESSVTLTSTTNTLNYQLVDTINLFDYKSSIILPASTLTPSSVISFMQSLLANDINVNTKNAYNLTVSSIGITYSSSTGLFTFLLPMLPNVTLTLFFSQNVTIGSLFGMGTITPPSGTDLVIFTCTMFTSFTSTQQIAMSISNYKGWNIYALNGGNYVYLDPKLYIIAGGSNTCASIPCSETIVTSLAPYTQITTGTTPYYILPDVKNNSSTPYFLTKQLSGYALNSDTPISLNDTPLNLGYQLITSPAGLNYYKDNSISYFVLTNQTTLVQVSTTPVSGVTLHHTRPDILSYQFKQGTRTITGMLDFPGKNYDSVTFAQELVYLLTQNINSQGINVNASNFNITFDKTSTLMNFSAVSNIPFQLLLEFGKNSIMASNFGVTGDVVVVTTYPPQIGPRSAISMNPYSLSYSFKDANFDFISKVVFPMPFTYTTPTAIASTLATLLASDINENTTYQYTASSFIFQYIQQSNTFLLSVDPSRSFTPFNPCTVVLRFTKDVAYPSPNTILPSTWAQVFGFISDTTLTKTPTASILASVIQSPMSLSYLCTDSANVVNISSSIVFDDSLVTNKATLDTYITNLTTLLSEDIMRKQSTYTITPSSFLITYSGSDRVVTFGFGPSIPLTLTLQFSLSPLLASNFGCSEDITFASIVPFVAPTIAVQSFAAHSGIEVYTINNKPCAFISGLHNFYPFIAGKQTCSFGQCKESTPVSLDDLRNNYTNLGGAFQKTGNTFIYDASYQVLYPISNVSQPSLTIYGSYSDNGYTQLSTCTLDDKGNCTGADATAVPIAYLTSNKSNIYAFVTTQQSLIQFATNSTQVTQCPCQTTKTISPTCNQICSLQKDESGKPLKCQNPGSTGVGNCQCYETGPVNVIIEPMQTYNPFRLIQSGVSAGFNELSKGISYVVKNFLVPIWNTIRLVVSFAASIITMVLQFIIQYGNPVYWFNEIKSAILASSGENAILAKVKEFINNSIMPGLQFIWDQRLVLLNGITAVASKAWGSILGVLSTISKGLASIFGTLITYIGKGIEYLWYFASWFVSKVVDVATPFIPIPKLLKFNIVMLALILVIGFIFGIDEIIFLLIKLLNLIVYQTINFVSHIYALLQDIITGRGSG
jgi:hypothetical protein